MRAPTSFENPEIMEMLGFGFSHKQVESSKCSSIILRSFPAMYLIIFRINGPKNAKQSPKCWPQVCLMFSLFSINCSSLFVDRVV